MSLGFVYKFLFSLTKIHLTQDQVGHLSKKGYDDIVMRYSKLRERKVREWWRSDNKNMNAWMIGWEVTQASEDQ